MIAVTRPILPSHSAVGCGRANGTTNPAVGLSLKSVPAGTLLTTSAGVTTNWRQTVAKVLEADPKVARQLQRLLNIDLHPGDVDDPRIKSRDGRPAQVSLSQ
jgi:hypothetical protein